MDQEEGLPAAVQKSPYHPAVIRVLVGKHHSRHEADRHAGCREKQNFAQLILQVQNFPAMHPYAPVPKGTAWQLGRLGSRKWRPLRFRTRDWLKCALVATARADPKQLVKLRV